MSRTVTGTLLLPNGQPMANARIFFTAKRTEAVSIIEGVNAFFDTNGSGVYNQVIVDGLYSVSIEWQADPSGVSSRRWNLGDAVVEGGANTTLEALLIATNPPEDVALTVFYEILEQTQQARDDAEAAAIAAAASAATISPTKQAQWDQAYSERNRWDGGNSGLNAATGRASLDLVKTSSSTDNSNNRMLQTGDHGIAGLSPLVPGNDLFTVPGGLRGGIFKYEGSTSNPPSAGTNGIVFHGCRASGGGEVRFIGRDTDTVNGGRAWLQYRSVGSFQTAEFYHTHNTSADVQALLAADNKQGISNAATTQGTFTPNAEGTGSAGTCTYGARTGRYQRAGNRCAGQINLSWSGHTGTGGLIITGLPLTAANVSGHRAACSLWVNGIAYTAGRVLEAEISPNATSIRIYESANSGSTTNLVVPASAVTLTINFDYEV
jgi:hypothetical protein